MTQNIFQKDLNKCRQKSRRVCCDVPINAVRVLNDSLLNVLWSQKKQLRAHSYKQNARYLLANDRKDISKWRIAGTKVFVTFVSPQY